LVLRQVHSSVPNNTRGAVRQAFPRVAWECLKNVETSILIFFKAFPDSILEFTIMLERHENALNDFLEKVLKEGFAVIEKWKFLLWYGQEKYTITIRRDINTRWNKYSKNELIFAESNQQILLMQENIIDKDPVGNLKSLKSIQ
jgi:hypothetical protein